MFAILHVLWIFVLDIFKSRRRLEAENLFLHHQLNIALRRAPPRLRLYGSDRALLVWMTRIWPGLLDISRVVKPETILRWHRFGFKAFWRWMLHFQLSRFSTDREVTWPSFAYGLCDQLATAFVRVKDEPATARECYAMAMAALSTAFAINRLKTALNGPLPLPVNQEIEMLLGRVSETLARPSQAGLLKRASEARNTRMRILNDARQTNTILDSRALGRALVGCAH
jgi:hypothetical protein